MSLTRNTHFCSIGTTLRRGERESEREEQKEEEESVESNRTFGDLMK